MSKLSVTKTTSRVIKNNLKCWYEKANKTNIKDGLSWYKDAQDFAKYLSTTYDIDSYTCATVISCLSPNNKWERNKLDAENVIKHWLSGGKPKDIKVCTYNNNKNKAFKALDGKMISEKAPKTHAFAMNIGLLSNEHITIDKWHLRACLTKPQYGIVDCVESCTPVQYRRVEHITSDIAKEIGISGYQLQAIIWITIKESWNR